MSTQLLDCATVLAQLGERRRVSPNIGFLYQLEIYGNCDYDMDGKKGRQAVQEWRDAKARGAASGHVRFSP